MEYSVALEKKKMLKLELNRIYCRISSNKLSPSKLPVLVNKECKRLSDDLGKAESGLSFCHPTVWDAIRIPIEGESMLSELPTEFDLSSAEETEKFKQNLISSLEELNNSTERFWSFPNTSEFIQKVIDHAQVYLEKQRLYESAVFGPRDDQIVEMDFNTTRAKTDRLLTEMNLIKSHAIAKAVDVSYLMKLMETEHTRLSVALVDGLMSMENSLDEIKIPVDGVSMLSLVPVEYTLFLTSDIQSFILRLRNELGWIMSLGEQFPLTFEFIDRVIGYAERYMNEKRPFEVAVFGRSTNNQTTSEVISEGTSTAH